MAVALRDELNSKSRSYARAGKYGAVIKYDDIFKIAKIIR